MKIAKILKESLEKWASDVILTSWTFPVLKVNWDVVYLEDYWVYSAEELKNDLFSTMSEKQKKEISEEFAAEILEKLMLQVEKNGK